MRKICAFTITAAAAAALLPLMLAGCPGGDTAQGCTADTDCPGAGPADATVCDTTVPNVDGSPGTCVPPAEGEGEGAGGEGEGVGGEGEGAGADCPDLGNGDGLVVSEVDLDADAA